MNYTFGRLAIALGVAFAVSIPSTASAVPHGQAATGTFSAVATGTARADAALQPYSAPGTITRLTGVIEGKGEYGSAAILNSPSGTLIVTAAHVIGRQTEYTGDEGRAWRFRAARGSAPSNDYSKKVWKSKRAWVTKGWADLGEGDNQYSDIAIVELEPDENGQTIQEVAGGGLTPELNADASPSHMTMYGYPFGNLGQQGQCYEANIQRQKAPANREGTRLYSPSCTMGPGASGGPYADPETMRLFGVHATGVRGGVAPGSWGSDTAGPQFHELWARVKEGAVTLSGVWPVGGVGGSGVGLVQAVAGMPVAPVI